MNAHHSRCPVSSAPAGHTRIIIETIISDAECSNERAAELTSLYLPGITAAQVKAHRDGRCICYSADEVARLLSPTSSGEHADAPNPRPRRLSKEWEPQVVFGDAGLPSVIVSPAMPAEVGDEGALQETLDFFGATIPAGYRARVVQISLDEVAWTRAEQGEDAVTRPGRRIKWIVERDPGFDYRVSDEEVADLTAIASEASISAIRALVEKRDAPRSLVACLADWQLGQADGDGLVGQVRRIGQIGTWIRSEVERLDRAGSPVSEIVLAGLGDLVEGCDGFYASQTFSVQADRRGQVTLARRLLVGINKDALLTGLPVRVVGVAGNHGEYRRNGKSFTTPGDNDDLAILEQVHDIFEAAGESRVTFSIPRDRLNLTIDIRGHIVGMTHGHLARGGTNPAQKAENWWKNQAMAREAIGDADILMQGHYHHTVIADLKGRLFLQAPAMCDRSAFFAEAAGLVNRSAGLMTFTIAEGQERVDNIRVHEDFAVVADQLIEA